jgi:hypothetical protein
VTHPQVLIRHSLVICVLSATSSVYINRAWDHIYFPLLLFATSQVYTVALRTADSTLAIKSSTMKATIFVTLTALSASVLARFTGTCNEGEDYCGDYLVHHRGEP